MTQTCTLRTPKLTTSLLVLLLIAPLLTAQEEPQASRVVERGPDHNVLETVESVQVDGATRWQTNRVELVEPGMNVLREGQWVPASPRLRVSPDGLEAASEDLSYRAAFASTPVAATVFQITMPDGRVFSGRVLGLAYSDDETSILIAWPREVVGRITGPEQNEVVFESAFDGVDADLFYRVEKSRVSQNLLFKSQVPPPSAFGLSDEAQLILWTEILSSPEIDQNVRVVREPGPDQLEMTDEELKMGSMLFTDGKAFQVGEENVTIPVFKSLYETAGRRFLLEKVVWKEVQPDLQELAPLEEAAVRPVNPRPMHEVLAEPRQEQAAVLPAFKPRLVASLDAHRRSGFLWDFEIVASISSKIWKSDTTYLLTNVVTVQTNLFEAGTVLKYRDNAKLTITGPNTWPSSGPPVVLTSVSDDTHGEKITWTNAPPSNWWAEAALEVLYGGSYNQIWNVRVLNARKGIVFGSSAVGVVRHLQMINVNQGLSTTLPSNGAIPYSFYVFNGLMDRVKTNFLGVTGTTGLVQHVTVNTADSFSHNNLASVRLVNSVLAAVGAGTNNLNSTNILWRSSTNGLFQPVGAGGHYLAAAHRIQGSGDIDYFLTLDLRKMTVVPPQILVSTYTNDTTLPKLITDYGSFPKCGFHYPRFDYAVSNITVENCTLTLASGVSMLAFGDRAFTLRNGGKVIGQGLHSDRIKLDHYKTVQEQPLFWGPSNTFDFFKVGTISGTVPEVNLRFTDIAVLAAPSNKRVLIYDNPLNLNLRDSSFRSVTVYCFGPTVPVFLRLTNNFWYRGSFSTWQNYSGFFYPISVGLQNNTFLEAAFDLHYANSYNGTWGIYDNLFCKVAMSASEHNGGLNPLPNSHNAYHFSTPLPSGSSNITITTLDWVTGELGSVYYPTISVGQNLGALIDRGSTSATNVGLAHFTTQADQTLEGSSRVDIGAHVAAVYPSWDPGAIDSDRDGLANYLADVNGDMIKNGSEVDWHKPVIVLPGQPPVYSVFSPAIPIDATAQVVDPNTATYPSGTLTVDLVNTVLPAEDRLEVISSGSGPGGVALNGSSVSFEGTAFATMQTLSNQTKLVFTFNNTAAATRIAAQALIRAIGYRNLSNSPFFMHRSARYVLSDGAGGTSNPAYQVIQVGCPPKLDVVMLVDRTGSLTQQDFTNGLIAASTLLSQLDLTKDQVSIMSFCNTAAPHTVNSNNTQIFSTNLSVLQSNLTGIGYKAQPCDGTTIDGPIGQAQTFLNANRRVGIAQPLILLITDGIDNALYPITQSEQAKISGTRIMSFGVASVNEYRLKRWSSCDWDYHRVADSNALAQAMLQIASEQCRALNLPPTITLLQPTNNSTWGFPTQIPMEAVAADPGGRVVKVEFYAGGTLLSEDVWPPYKGFFTPAAPGTYSLSAVAVDDTGLRTGSSNVTVVVAASGARTYTKDVDFAQGALLNVNSDDVSDQLALNFRTQPFPYINIARTASGKMRRLEVRNGVTVGEYYTAPATNTLSQSPMALAVDKFGNVWLGNMWESNSSKGSVVCIGLVIGGTRGNKVSGNFVPDPSGEYLQGPFLYNTCIDRDGDGLIRTSKGQNQVLPWSGTTVAGAADEAILHYVRTDVIQPYGIAIDPNNDVWVAGRSTTYAYRTVPIKAPNGTISTYDLGYFFSAFQKIAGVGSVLTNAGSIVTGSYFTNTAGGASSVVDSTGILWSATEIPDHSLFWGVDGLLRRGFSPVTNQFLGDVYWVTGPGGSTGVRPTPQTNGAAALALDPATGRLWFAGYHQDKVWSIPPTGWAVSGWETVNYPQGHAFGCGVAVDEIGHVWISHNLKFGDGPNSIGHVRTDGTYVGNVYSCPGSGGTGVSIDTFGKAWVVMMDYNKEYAIRINPDGGPLMLNDNLDENGFPVGEEDLKVSLGTGSSPMSVGDMTGFSMIAATAPSGAWTVVHDGGSTTNWGTVSWTASTPANTSLSVVVRSHSQRAGLTQADWKPVANGVALSPNLTGRFLEVQVRFSRSFGSTNRPILYDLTVTPAGQSPTTIDSTPRFAVDDTFSLFMNQTSILHVLANDRDPSGGSLQIAEYMPPSFGVMSITNGAFSYSSLFGYQGADQFVYAATNASGAKSWGLARLLNSPVPPVPSLPLAVDDFATIPANVPDWDPVRVLSVLTNDTNWVRIVRVSQPENGIVQIGNTIGATDCDGTNLIYTPNRFFAGYDSITYSIASPSGQARSATVHIHVTGDPVIDLECGKSVNGSITAEDQLSITDASQRADYFRYPEALGAQFRLTTFPGANAPGSPVSISSNGYIYVMVPASTTPAPYAIELKCEVATPAFLAMTTSDVTVTNNAALDFGLCDTSKTHYLPLVLVNYGANDMNLSSPTGTGSFDIYGFDPGGFPLAPLSAKTVKIRFSPNGIPGPHSGTVSFTTDASNASSVSFSLTAYGMTNPPTVVLKSPTNEANTFVIPSQIPLVASADGSGSSITNVYFVASRVRIEESLSDEPPIHWALSGTGTRFLAKGDYDGTEDWTNIWSYAGEQTYRIFAAAQNAEGNVGVSGYQFADSVKPGPEANRPPIARDDTFLVPANSTNFFLNLLANDSDPDGDSFTLSQLGKPGFGLIKQSGQQALYTPPYQAIGTNSFGYQIKDSAGNIGRGSVTLQVTAIPAPSITLTSPAPDSVTQLPASIELAVTTNGPVKRLEFFVNGVKVGETNGPNYKILWGDTTPGEHLVWALATGNAGLQAVSEPARITLLPKPGNRIPFASISNLAPTNDLNVVDALDLPGLPVVREGFLDVVGCAKDADNDPVTYKIRVKSTADGQVLRTFSFTGAKPGPTDLLGTIDLSTIDNGIYDISLEVRDGSDSAVAERRIVLDTQLKIGQFTFTEEDLVIPVSGFPLTVTRTYDSLNPRSGDFGHSWTYTLSEVQMEVDEERDTFEELVGRARTGSPQQEGDNFQMRIAGGRNVTLTLPDGRRATFTFSMKKLQPSSGCGDCYEALWTAPPGVYATLRTPTVANGTDMFADNVINPYGPGYATWQRGGAHTPWEHYDVPAFILTMPDGTQYRITREPPGERDHYFTFNDNSNWVYVEPRQKARIESVTQRAGDQIRVQKDRIDHYTASNQLTRSILFERDGLGRIKEVRDPVAGPSGIPVLRYEYDYETGNLIRVYKLVDRLKATYTTNRYEYTNSAFPHYLTGIIDARGVNIARSLYDSQGRLQAIINASGFTNSFIHATSNRQEIAINPQGFGVTNVYDRLGNITNVIDAFGKTNHFVYDTNNGALLRHTDPLGNTTTYTNDTRGNVLSVTLPHPVGANPDKYRTQFTYNSYDQQTSVTYPSGAVVTNSYDSLGNLTSVKDGSGTTLSSWNYDLLGRVQQEADALGSLTFGYDSLGNLTNMLDSLGQSTGSTHDPNGNLVTLTANGSTSRFTVDAQGRELLADYGNGLTVASKHVGNQDWSTIDGPSIGHMERRFDEQNRLAGWVTANGGTPGFAYDSVGRLAFETNSIGVVSKTTYDAVGRVITVTNLATGGGRGFAYDAAGRRIAETNTFGHTTRFTLNPDGSLAGMTNAFGTNSWSYSYDVGAGCCGGGSASIKTVDPLGRTNTIVRSALGLPIQTVFAAGTNQTSASVTYLAGMVSPDQEAEEYPHTITDEGGRARSLRYTAIGQLDRATDLGGLAWWTNRYDGANGNLTNILSPTGEFSRHQYDSLGNVISITNRGIGLLQNFYHPTNNRLLSTILPSAETVLLNYDFAGRVTNRQVYVNGAVTESVALGYSLNDSITNMSDLVGTTSRTFDSAGRLTRIDYPGGGSVAYDLDKLDRVTNVTVKASSSGTAYSTKYWYDAIGNITSILDPWGGVTSLEYDRVGRKTRRTLPNGVGTGYAYNWRDQVTNIIHTNATGVLLASVAYERAAGGEPTKITREDGSYVTLKYDASLRLTNETFFASGGTPTGTNGYGYDLSGTRISLTTPTVSLTNAVAAGFQVQQVKYRTNGAVAETYSFDTGGRMTSIIRGGTTNRFGYNAAGQITAQTNGTAWTLYTHDGEGRRLRSTNNLGVARRFLVAGTPGTDLDSPLLIADHANALKQAFVYLGDDPLMRFDGSGSSSRTYYLEDGMGSVIGIAPQTTPGTNNTSRLFYDGFGRTRTTNGPAPALAAGTEGDFRFHGAWWETASDMYNMRAREYDPRTGRFLSRDPYFGDTKIPESMHPYTFANANPHVYVDPTGQFSLIEINVAAAVQSGLQGFRAAAIQKARQRITDELVEGLSGTLWGQLKQFLPLNLEKFTNIPGELGDRFQLHAQTYICKAFKKSDMQDNFHYSVRVHNSGRRSGDPFTPGRHCENVPNPGQPGAQPTTWAVPDFIISGSPPYGVRGGMPDAWVVGDFKASSRTFYNSYILGSNRDQFTGIIDYAKGHTYSHTAAFIVGWNNLGSHKRNQSAEWREIRSLLGRQLTRRGVVGLMIVLWN